MTTTEDKAREWDFIAAEDWIKSDYAKAVLSLPIERAREMMFEVFRAGYQAAIAEERQRIWDEMLSRFSEVGELGSDIILVSKTVLQHIIFGDSDQVSIANKIQTRYY